MEKLILHEYAPSGNCYKIRLTAALLGVPLERRHYDIMRGETRTAAFLAEVNANGRIPTLQIGERFLPESNAACWWLAHDTALIPGDRFDQADMLRWMFFEQYNHEPNIATLRFWKAMVGEERLSDTQRAQIPARQVAGEAALALMDDHLSDRCFFVGERVSLADICLYAYTHVADEGGFDLKRWPAVQRWIAAVAATPGYVALAD
ncbi:glutathione S-transferase family protein [Sphingomonas crusticola]|uniref:glutathione S-transferase family protein n=1 Tax=Sphingomonas crusticola TaxID=1697973 RepID=UPI000E273317|nr:glutathione S-transferase [Sphingomonas crusticola]